MNGMKSRWGGRNLLALAAVLSLLVGGRLRGDTLTLNDGTALEGKVIKQGTQYWVKTEDGETHLIPIDKVKSLKKGDSGGDSGGPKPGTSTEFLAAKRTAEAMLIAPDAGRLWEAFIAAHPGSADLPAAEGEMGKWKAMGDSEKIRGRWVSGAERTALIERATAIAKQGADDMKENRSIAAIEKFKEADKIYPNDYGTNYALGFLSLAAKKNEEALPYFEQALRLRPQSFSAMNNMAVALWETKQFERSMALFLQAAKKGDSLVLAKNLASAVALIPPAQTKSAQSKEMTGISSLLNNKYQLPPGGDHRFWFQPPVSSRPNDGAMAAGSGFVISGDGLILTNRHVAGFGDKIVVKMPDGREYPASVVVIDKDQDLALIRVSMGNQKSPFLIFSSNDLPNEGAQCFALGFPLIEQTGATLKITQGIVSGLRPTDAADILIDAKVNPGNSGGPLLDKHGQIIGIVTRKSFNSQMEDSYGIAISTGKIRLFLQKNSVSVTSETANASALSAEEIVAKTKSATVCIIVTRGGPGTTQPSGKP
jgi:S1-C subfamily serine protease